MSLLRTKELEQQLERRDERLAQIEAKIFNLTKYDHFCTEACPDFESSSFMDECEQGLYVKVEDVLKCF
jgi:hypothetical protein